MSEFTIPQPARAYEPTTVRSLPTLNQIAVEELRHAGGDRAEAISAMVQRLLSDEILREALIVPIVRNVCQQQISLAVRNQRERVWHAPTRKAGQSRVRTAAAVNKLSLMNFRLPSGKRLGDASGAEVRAASVDYLTQGRDRTIKGRWLGAVADAVPVNKIVRRVLDETRLGALRSKAEAVA